MDDFYAGVETWYADGSGQIAVTDRLTQYVTRGTLNIPNTWPPDRVRTVAVPGIKNDGTWFVNATGLCMIQIFDGYFRYERIDYQFWTTSPVWENEGPTVFYSVMRL